MLDYFILFSVFIVVLVMIFKYWDFKNPYVDELISEKEVDDQDDQDEWKIGKYTERLFKRTYKNGKIKYVTKIY